MDRYQLSASIPLLMQVIITIGNGDKFDMGTPDFGVEVDASEVFDHTRQWFDTSKLPAKVTQATVYIFGVLKDNLKGKKIRIKMYVGHLVVAKGDSLRFLFRTFLSTLTTTVSSQFTVEDSFPPTPTGAFRDLIHNEYLRRQAGTEIIAAGF